MQEFRIARYSKKSLKFVSLFCRATAIEHYDPSFQVCIYSFMNTFLDIYIYIISPSARNMYMYHILYQDFQVLNFFKFAGLFGRATAIEPYDYNFQVCIYWFMNIILEIYKHIIYPSARNLYIYYIPHQDFQVSNFSSLQGSFLEWRQ